MFANYQPYVIECGIKSNSDILVKKGYLTNPLNKLYIEKSGLYFINKNDVYGFNIFKNAYSRDPNDPVYMYYYGLSNEIFGNKIKALELYKAAQANSTNFYLNQSALKRLDPGL